MPYGSVTAAYITCHCFWIKVKVWNMAWTFGV